MASNSPLDFGSPGKCVLKMLLAVPLSAHGLEVSAGGVETDANAHWLRNFSREILATDTPVATSKPTWTRTGNGDTVLATISGDDILLRRMADDGTTLSTRLESAAGTGNVIDLVRLLETPDRNAIYVLAGNESVGCLIIRYRPDWSTEWSRPVPSAFPGASGCSDMAVLDDGSVLTLNRTALTRFAEDGEEMWSVKSGDDNWYLNGNDLLVADNGAIWVASNGGTLDTSNVATVLRFALDGTRLPADSFLCPTCIASSVQSLDLMADGRVLASGTSGSGQPGFFARYTADGTRELLTESEPGIGYRRVTHDTAGAIYVLAAVGLEAVEARRLDPATGAVLWSREGSDMVALDSGIVVTRMADSSIDAVAFNAFGGVRWTQPLVTQPNGWVSRARAADQKIEWLGYGDVAATAACGSAPRLIALDANAGDASVRQPCLMPGQTSIREIDARATVGVLANLDYRLAAFSEDGVLRWDAIPCPLCVRGTGFLAWGQAILTDDAGAWAVAARQEADDPAPFWSTRILRLDAQGDEVSSVPFSPPVFETYDTVSLLGTADEVVALQPRLDVESSSSWLVWQRSRSDGSVLETREHVLPWSFVELKSVRRLADGGVSAVAANRIYCDLVCETRYVMLLRFAADGTERWRYELPPVSDPFPDHVVTLHADGSATAVIYAGEPNGYLQKREIDVDGNAGVDMVLTDIPPFTTPTRLSSGSPGEYLLRTSAGGSRKLLRLDVGGTVQGSVSVDGYGPQTLASSLFGELLREDAPGAPDAVLFDRETLLATATFGFGAAYLDGSAQEPWRALEDGSVYGVTATIAPSGIRQATLGRFTVPGSPADTIFSDGFE